MNKDINLYEILKGHENEIFYSPIFGYMTLISLKSNEFDFPLQFLPIDCNTRTINFPSNGKYWGNDYPNGECQIFPSKNQRDWNKWIEEQKSKTTPKTWDEFIKQFRHTKDDLSVDLTGNKYFGWTRRDTPIEKSALALLKIHQLIEVSYGGNITNEEWSIYGNVSFVIFCNDCGEFEITRSNERQHLAFHTQKQAEEFLSHEENIQLLKDYFMI